VQSLADAGPLDIRAVLGAVRSAGFGDVLSEAGPTMTGQLLAQGLLDELFLTVSPVLIGGGWSSRPGMAGGTRLLPTGAPWGELVSSRRHGSHLFLRYRARTR